MSAMIRDYSLYLAEPRQGKNEICKPYDSSWDNWVLNEKDIRRLLEEIRRNIREGKQPIVTVFTPGGR